MGVYINMEMPKSCEECRFCVNGWCYVLRPESEEERKRITTNYCPLIEIPPHGRLIDADALKEAFCGNCFADEKPMECSEPCMDMRIILETPTIIPAEPPKEET